MAADPSTASTDRPIRLVVSDDLERSRLTVFFRLLLAIPHLVWLVLWSAAAFTLAFVVWLAVLFERRAPRTLHNFMAAYVRYATHLLAYLSLTANPYPSFTGKPGYPVDVEIDPPALQGRWGAGFRIVLAFPALLLAAFMSGRGDGTAGVLLVVGFLGWFAVLVRGAMPRGLRDFGLYALGYGAQTYGYLLLLTDRYPSSDPQLVRPAVLPEHPVAIRLSGPLEQSRLLVFFRLLLLLPHIVWLLLWSVAVVFVEIVAWLAALVVGRVPTPLWRFLAAYVRYTAHLSAFGYMVGGQFPGFTGTQGSYPVDLTIEQPGAQRRLVTLFRLFLAIPAFLVAGAYGGILLLVAVFGWFAALVTGRMPEGLRTIGAAGIRYSSQAHAYAALVTDRYPYAAPFLRDEESSAQLALELLPAAAPGTFGEPD